MMRGFLFLVVILGSLLSVSRAGEEIHNWNYENEGPDAWPHAFAKCKGLRQSPIDIVKSNVEYDKNLKPVLFKNYDRMYKWNVSHNGHSVVVSRNNDAPEHRIQITGSDFDTHYDLIQFHFHWGHNNFQGSEHYISGEKFPLEVHFVHKSPKGTYAVLGFLFKLSKNNNTAWESVFNGVHEARTEEESFETLISLVSLLPTEVSRYYRYSGSLTTPPCTEGVVWTVFTEYIPVSAEQLMSFRNNKVKLNFRHPQKLNSRKVFSSFPVTKIAVHKKPSADSQVKKPQSHKSAASSTSLLPLSAILALSVVPIAVIL